MAVVVLTGTLPFGHLTETGQVIVLPAVPSLVKCNVNAIASDVTPLPRLNAKVAFALNVAVIKLPLATFSVGADPVLPCALSFSA